MFVSVHVARWALVAAPFKDNLNKIYMSLPFVGFWEFHLLHDFFDFQRDFLGCIFPVKRTPCQLIMLGLLFSVLIFCSVLSCIALCHTVQNVHVLPAVEIHR